MAVMIKLFAIATAMVTAVQAMPHLPFNPPFPVCNPATLKVRKEWGDLKPVERKAYTDAVRCLQKKPSKLDHNLYNTTTRYEDFVAVHINLTRTIHNDGLFLPWHRNFVNTYETALIDECGYKGAQPYWHWIKNAKNLTASPMFDGSEYSMSGQGAKLSPADMAKQPPCRVGNFTCPNGDGGGCVTTGPFKDYKIGFLPASPLEMVNPDPAIPKTAFAYQSRCFSRNLNQWLADNVQTEENLRNLQNAKSFIEFQGAFDNASGQGFGGLHPLGHWTLGPTGADIFSSPADPAFFLHHAMLDKTWLEWQLVNPGRRIFGDDAIGFTVTGLNVPPSENATFGHMLTWPSLAKHDLPVGAMQAVGLGELCYRYQ